MAEYLAEMNNGDVEEEEEFQEEDEDDEEYERKKSAVNCPVLQGRLKLNEEGRLLYLGTWCMKHDLNASASAASINKKTTFKLKSIQPMSKFTLAKPTLNTKVVMNGFFHTDHTDQIQPHRKIKEKGVTLEFTPDGNNKNKYQVKGNGTNEFGAFALQGTYTPNEKAKTYWLQCEKFYGGIPEEESDDEIDSEDEQKDPQELDDLQDDAELTVEELQRKYYGGGNNAPPTPPKAKNSSSRRKAERHERLEKRHKTNGTIEEEEDSKPPAKKLKTDKNDESKSSTGSSPLKKKIIVAVEDDDDDDDCGF